MKQTENQLIGHINDFRKKYYLNRIIRGSIGLLLIISSIMFLSVMGEGLLGFSSGVRTGIISVLAITFFGIAAYYVFWPLAKLINLSQPISNMEVASLIRKHFPEIDDKLINLLELQQVVDPNTNSLALAAIQRKTDQLAPVRFSTAINLNVNWDLAKYLAIPAGLFLLMWIIRPDLMNSGANRLVNFGQDFLPPPPFDISVNGHKDQLIAGQSFTSQATLSGVELPAELYLYLKKGSEADYINYPMEKLRADEFAYELNNIKEDFNYYIGNEDVRSEIYGVDVLVRPSIRDFRVVVDYPDYSGIKDDTLGQNIGDFKVLRGSQVKWIMETQGSVKEAKFFGNDTIAFKQVKSAGHFSHEKRILSAEQYFISLVSKRYIPNIDTVKYHIDVLQDRFPSVYVSDQAQEFIADFSMFMPLNFEISDDYGFSKLSLFYRFSQSEKDEKVAPQYQEINLTIQPKQLLQEKSMEVDLMTLGMEEGDIVEYYVKVWDNDMIAGPKPSSSSIFLINYPSLNEKFDEVEEKQDEVKAELEKLIDDVEEIKNTMEKFQEKMLDQKNMSFDDKKELQNMLDKHQSVQDRIEEMKEKFEETKETLENNQMISENTLQKYEQLNELMDKLNNEKLNEYMDKMREKMDEMNPEQMKKMMEKMEFNEEDLEKALERTMELLKQLEVQQKAEELLQKLDNLQKKQDMLKEQMENTSKKEKEKLDDLAKKQDELKKEMEDIQKEMEELSEMKKDTQTPNEDEMNELKEDAQDSKEDMENASDEMQKKNKKKAGDSQKNASDKMEEMKEALQSMMQSSASEQDQQNLDDLRDLLENLLKLSFRQEDVRDEIKGIRPNDPVLFAKEVVQKQLLDDMYMVKDSLDELAKKVFQIEKFVTDESNQILKSMKSAGNSMESKRIPRVTEHQHQSMTSINNLANMLTDVMQQMQQQMKNQKGGMSKCDKPGGGMPNMQKLGKKQGELNQMMQQMMNSGGMNPQKLAEMAKAQQMLRNQLKDAHNKIKEEGGSSLGDMGQIMKDMKDTEDELKNKILSEATMKRQRRIMSRLLDSMKSVREKEQFEERRKSKTGNEIDRLSPDKLEIEEYKNKLRQEMLKSNQLEYSSDFIILIEKYFKLLEGTNE